MLSKDRRLNLKKDFKWVALGKKLETKYLKLFFRPGENEVSRVGIATPGKAFNKASQRNRARRLASAAFEALYSRLPNYINIVALPKTGILEVKSGDVLLDLEEELKREKIL